MYKMLLGGKCHIKHVLVSIVNLFKYSKGLYWIGACSARRVSRLPAQRPSWHSDTSIKTTKDVWNRLIFCYL